mgnify:CR=1 FL=1
MLEKNFNNYLSKNQLSVISLKLQNQMAIDFIKVFHDWQNQFDFEGLPKKYDKNRILEYLFFYGKLGLFYIPELDDFNFYPFQIV